MKTSFNPKRLYVYSLLFSYIFVFTMFSLQIILVYKIFELKMIVAPLIVSTIFGLLVAKILILQKELLHSQKIFSALADQGREFSYFKRFDGSYEYVSPAAQMLTGYTQQEFYENPNFFDTLVMAQYEEKWQTHLDNMSDMQEYEDVEIKIMHKDGKEVWINHNCSVVYGEDGKKIGIRAVNSDITQKKLDEFKIEELAKYDSLTGLPNRTNLVKIIDDLIGLNTPFSIMFVDLNRFKKINDSLGHKIGDEVLKEVARKFNSCLEYGYVAGRLGGDEFLIVMPNLMLRESVYEVAKRVLVAIAHEYTVANHSFYIGASIGISSFPKDSNNRQTLLSCADNAMLEAKNVNTKDIVFYEDIAKNYSYDDFMLEKDLRKAIETRELEVYMQPKYNTYLEKIDSFEALVRWRHAGEQISPARFIPIAEDTGLIKSITHFVIDDVFKYSSRLRVQGKYMVISINLSPIDLVSASLVNYISQKIAEYKVDAKMFEFEITESIFMDGSQRIAQNISTLLEMGFHFALDDFGTGYSSFSYITKFPIKTLKIDKVFVDSLEDDFDKNYPLLKSIVNLAANMNFSVVVEGVENQKQVNILKELGCYLIQGYFYYKPMPQIEASKLI